MWGCRDLRETEAGAARNPPRCQHSPSLPCWHQDSIPRQPCAPCTAAPAAGDRGSPTSTPCPQGREPPVLSCRHAHRTHPAHDLHETLASASAPSQRGFLHPRSLGRGDCHLPPASSPPADAQGGRTWRRLSPPRCSGACCTPSLHDPTDPTGAGGAEQRKSPRSPRPCCRQGSCLRCPHPEPAAPSPAPGAGSSSEQAELAGKP